MKRWPPRLAVGRIGHAELRHYDAGSIVENAEGLTPEQRAKALVTAWLIADAYAQGRA